jgi:hypothetical protein
VPVDDIKDSVATFGTATGHVRWATTMQFSAGSTLLVINELGYLPLPTEVV